MVQIHGEQARRDALRRHPRSDPIGDLVQPLPLGPKQQMIERLAHPAVSLRATGRSATAYHLPPHRCSASQGARIGAPRGRRRSQSVIETRADEQGVSHSQASSCRGSPMAAFALAAFLVHRALQQYGMSEILEFAGRRSRSRHLALGAAFTAGSFLCLTGSDTLAVRYTGRDLPYRKIALASFTSLSIGHTVGLAALSSGAVRYRFYTGWGLSPGDVGRIVAVLRHDRGARADDRWAASPPDPARPRRRDVRGRPGGRGRRGHPAAARGRDLSRACGVRAPADPHPRLRAAGAAAAHWRSARSRSARPTSCWSRRSSIRCSRPRPRSASFPSRRPMSWPTPPAILTHVPGGLGVIEAVLLSLVPGANVVGAAGRLPRDLLSDPVRDRRPGARGLRDRAPAAPRRTASRPSSPS